MQFPQFILFVSMIEVQKSCLYYSNNASYDRVNAFVISAPHNDSEITKDCASLTHFILEMKKHCVEYHFEAFWYNCNILGKGACQNVLGIARTQRL